MGGLKSASKVGAKGKLVMPAKTKAAPKPPVKKLTNDHVDDGWDDF